MGFKYYYYFILFCTVGISCNENPAKELTAWDNLFDGSDLLQWDIFLGPKYTFDSLTMQWVTMGNPIGLNKDPSNEFSIVEVGGERILRISGQIWGGISTKESFQDYHLQLKFKWGIQKWPPRLNQKRDSGLLYHAVGEHGAGSGFWMRSQELQIQEGDVGDYWGVAGAIFDIPTILNEDSMFVYSQGSPLITFRENSSVGRHCIKDPDNENKTGEWNTIDLYCMGDTSIHMVNGKVNMILFNSRQLDREIEKPLNSGKLQIQSEGAEVFYKDIKIRSIKSLPKELML